MADRHLDFITYCQACKRMASIGLPNCIHIERAILDGKPDGVTTVNLYLDARPDAEVIPFRRRDEP
jgi:hypothetical protein